MGETEDGRVAGWDDNGGSIWSRKGKGECKREEARGRLEEGRERSERGGREGGRGTERDRDLETKERLGGF